VTTAFAELETCGPNRRRFIPGSYPTKRFESISGAGTTRLYGNKAFNAQLELTFTLNDADTCTVLECWDAARGTYDVLQIPEEFLVGSSPILDCGVPDYLNWRWAEAPSVESILPGRSRVEIKLVATLDA
jgi:hypothetical protein